MGSKIAPSGLIPDPIEHGPVVESEGDIFDMELVPLGVDEHTPLLPIFGSRIIYSTVVGRVLR